MREKYKKVISFLPGISIAEKIQVGDIALWPSNRIGEITKDTYLISSVKQIASRYYGSNGEKLKNVTIVETGNDFEPYDEETSEKINSAKSAVSFVTIKDNPSKVPQYGSPIIDMLFSYDNFTIYKHAVLPDGFMSYDCGSYIRNRTVTPIKNFRFYLPPFVEVRELKKIDIKMLGAFGKIMTERKKNPSIERIFQAIDWINLAYSNVHDFSNKTRIVLASTALESLFDLPEKSKTSCFTQHINRITEMESLKSGCIVLNQGSKEPFSYDQPRLKTELKSLLKKQYIKKIDYNKDCNEFGLWAKKFYELRSSIVHGNLISGEALRHINKKEHFQIAIAVLVYFVRDQLFLLDAYDYNMDEIIVPGHHKKIHDWFQ